jgi:23S rRNA pseudouridine1911/1915/1917 synthase
VYGGRPKLPKGANPTVIQALRDFRRQALHAVKLKLVHPEKDVEKQWAASVPRDMHELMEVLAADMIENRS